MNYLFPEDINKHGSAGFIGTKYFGARGRQMNEALKKAGLLSGDCHSGYVITSEGEEYSAGRDEWYFTIVNVLCERDPSLRRVYNYRRTGIWDFE